MSTSSGRRRTDDELFLKNGTENNAPVVAPLRIKKRDSDVSAQSAEMAAILAQPPKAAPTYPMPPLPTVSPMPDLPQIPGLPYPDNRTKSAGSNRITSTPSQYQYPDPTRRVASPASSRNGVPESPIDPTLRTSSAASGRTTASTTLAERRKNTNPQSLPDVAESESNRDSMFQAPLQRPKTSTSAASGVQQQQQQQQQIYPTPTVGAAAQAAFKRLNIRDPTTMARTDSVATTRAQRGSPPPPETPVLETDGRQLTDIERRFASSGIAGTGTLTALQAQSAASQARQASYGNRAPNQPVQQQQQPVPRPWTPTEHGDPVHTPSTMYQGDSELPTPRQQTQPTTTVASPRAQRPNAIENDMGRLAVSEEPPPAYASVTANKPGFPNEKGRLSTASAATVQSVPPVNAQTQDAPAQPHPAFANDPQVQSVQNGHVGPQQNQQIQRQPSVNDKPQPPPLPEGWIAHLDPNSGHWYYIHLPTQATQWEFPKGPTPLSLGDAPTSPGVGMQSPGLSFAQRPLNSPMFPTSPGLMSPGYDGQSVMGSMSGSLSNPATFGQLPPASGVETYKIAATNGVYFGPYLRYINMDLELGFWYGSIMLVTDAAQPPTIHIHQSTDLSPNPRQLKAQNIASHQRWTFYRYDVDLRMEIDGPAKWTYAITSHLGCTRYEFLVAGRYETSWRFVMHSNNDFSISTKQTERAALGGTGYMWRDILAKHAECDGFHTQLALGGQISADRLWRELPLLKQWSELKGKEAKKQAPWTAAHEEDVTHAYFHYYTSHFDQPYLREAFAQIPHISILNDGELFDGFGSYPEFLQHSNMFKNIGRIGIEFYLLFQHHTTLEILRDVSDDRDLFTVTGTGWHFVKYLGPAVACVGIDTRSERSPTQVLAGPTYQGVFPKIATLPQSVQHCLLMIAVPLLYPRFESIEQLASTVATGKKAITGAYNMLGKVTSNVAGVVGAKAAVGSGFESVKRAVGKSGLMGGILNQFGDVEMFDEMRDQWTNESKDLERTYLIRTLQTISSSRSVRFSFLSGSTNVCGAGLVHDPSAPQDHKSMYQLISSAVVAAPPSSYTLRFLNSNKPLYVPLNGVRTTNVPSDTKEDMIELFTTDSLGQPNTGNRRLCAKRNYVACVIFDPDAARDPMSAVPASAGGFGATGQREGGKVSIAADFLVQGDNGLGGVVKYGPVVIPSLDFGR